MSVPRGVVLGPYHAFNSYFTWYPRDPWSVKATVSAALALQSSSAQIVGPRAIGHSFAVGIFRAATDLVLSGADFRCSTIECVQMGAVVANTYEWFVAGFGDFDNLNTIPWHARLATTDSAVFLDIRHARVGCSSATGSSALTPDRQISRVLGNSTEKSFRRVIGSQRVAQDQALPAALLHRCPKGLRSPSAGRTEIRVIAFPSRQVPEVNLEFVSDLVIRIFHSIRVRKYSNLRTTSVSASRGSPFSVPQLNPPHRQLTTNLQNAAAFATDMLITFCLCWRLRKSRSGIQSTNKTLNFLIPAVNWSVFTVFVAALNIILVCDTRFPSRYEQPNQAHAHANASPQFLSRPGTFDSIISLLISDKFASSRKAMIHALALLTSSRTVHMNSSTRANKHAIQTGRSSRGGGAVEQHIAMPSLASSESRPPLSASRRQPKCGTMEHFVHSARFGVSISILSSSANRVPAADSLVCPYERSRSGAFSATGDRLRVKQLNRIAMRRHDRKKTAPDSKCTTASACASICNPFDSGSGG
ncbi:hypothetical protein GGX14DRAFT_392230 [Mycena pura]|uniref:Uncharacterized protein n=1 Tax=Mycena pura TaxID=153505 RepID=A0AAD6YDC0_9AGAR|nr:hypothetical protein GGX14DRAFT_392230 [Mycena pura]